MMRHHHREARDIEFYDMLQDYFEETAPLVLVRWDSGTRAEI